MNAKVRLFARLGELAGTRETDVELGEGLTARDVYALLCDRYPALDGLGDSLMYAVNAEYVSPEHPVRDGDELALIPPVSGGSELFEITPHALDPQRLVEVVRKDESGAVALFYGIVRNTNLGRRVLYLEYDAYPEMATKVMRDIAEEIKSRWPITAVAIQHRTGRLEIGETSLLVAISAPHRREAFEACHALVDRFKEIVPIWKKEVWEGGEEWIEGEAVDRT